MIQKKLAEYPKIFHWDYLQKENIPQKVLNVQFVAAIHVDAVLDVADFHAAVAVAAVVVTHVAA
jgi:hypothetical protein